MKLFLILALLIICSCKRDRSKYERDFLKIESTSKQIGNGVTIIGHPDSSWDEPKDFVESDQPECVILPFDVKGILLRRIAYTTSYNPHTRQPNWVAWHLTAEHTDGPYGRLGNFHEDEEVPMPRATLDDYRGSGWSRGHMCPAGDNKWDEEVMYETFALTNVCPQNASLNSGLWNRIEIDCRRWAKKYGDVYIVCGPLFLNREHETIGENRVVVPEAFFKVILCLRGVPKAIGYVVRNNEGKRKKDQFVNTVDDVERITGYDFFPALPDSIENEVEAHASLNEWE